MSDCIEKYNDYRCGMLVIGYAKNNGHIRVNRDICGLCMKYINISFQCMECMKNIEINKLDEILLHHAMYSASCNTFEQDSETKYYIMKRWKYLSKNATNLASPKVLQCITDNKLLTALQLCVREEFMLRLYNKVKHKGKMWFLGPEQASLLNIESYQR